MRIWWVSLFVKLILAYRIPFLSDEAYYWVWSHDLQLSYFDHPPLVAWLFKAGHVFEGWGQAVRWPAVVVVHMALLVWRGFLSRFLNQEQIKYWLLLTVLNPMTGLGSILVTPDIPLILFWSIALAVYVEFRESPTIRLSIVLGMAIGLGFMSKYNMVIMAPLIILDWLTMPLGKRKEISGSFGWGVFTAAIVALIAATPVWVWNLRHDFDSFLFQIRHGLGDTGFSALNVLNYFLEQGFVLFPTLVAAFFLRPKDEPGWLKLWSAGPLVFFALSSLKGRVEANWPLVAYPSVFALACARYTSFIWIKRTLGLWFVAGLIAVSEVIVPWIPVEPEKLKTYEFVVYDHLVPIAQEYTPFFASSFQMAATLSYEMKRPVYKLNGINRRDYYDYKLESFPTGDRFYLAARDYDSFPSWMEKSFVKSEIRSLKDGLILYEVNRRVSP